MKTERPITGSVQEKNGKLYYVINEYEGKKRRQDWVYSGYPARGNKKKAEAGLQKELCKRNEQKNKPSRLKDANADMPFIDFMRMWLKTKKNSISTITYQGYELMIEGRVSSYFSSCESTLGNLTPDDIEDFYATMYDEDLSGSTLLHYHRIISQALTYAVKKDILLYNVMDKVDAPKKGHYAADHYTREEAQQLLDAIKDDPIFIVVFLTTYYGLRRSEVMGLRWPSINFTENRISIEYKVLEEKVDGQTVVKGYNDMKTTASRRSMPLIPIVAEKLKKEKARQEENKTLFKNEYSKDANGYVCVDALGKIFRPNFVSSHFNLLLKKHNLRHIRFHDLRHTCASLLAASGCVSMKEVQLWMGHSNYSTTADIYAHLDFKAQEQCAAAMEQILG